MAPPTDDDTGTDTDHIGRDRAETRVEESMDRTGDGGPSIGRRPLLKALGAGAALSAGGGVATATDGDGEGVAANRVSQAEGFEAEVVAPHATFPDDVAAAFGVAYRDGAAELAVVPDVSTVLIVRATLAPGGTSGWHADRGPVVGSVVEGEIDVTFEGCVTRTYAAGEALVATGTHTDVVENASDTDRAVAYLVFLDVPVGESPSRPVEPPDC